MSMIGYLRQISPKAAASLRTTPATLQLVVESGAVVPAGLSEQTLEAALSRAPPAVREALLSGFRQQREAAAARDDTLRASGLSPEDLPGTLCLQKEWHGLHFLLSGSAGPLDTPLGTAILGGEELGDDLGYGPPRLLAPESVAAIASALEALSPEAFSERFDAPAMEQASLYPGGWSAQPEEARAALLAAFEQLRSYYRGARERGFGMLLYLA